MSARPAELQKLIAREAAHGTRARYVAHKCRCDACRAANAAYSNARDRAAKAAAAALVGVEAIGGQKAHGTKGIRKYKRICPGVNGNHCPKQTFLRKDSTPICAHCRPQLVSNALVDAGPARAHIERLAAKGVGRQAIHDACDVASSVLDSIVSGAQAQIRQETERRILAVDEQAMADCALVPAKETRARLRFMLRRGWTKKELARELGSAAKNPNLQTAFGRDFVLARTAHKVAKLHRSFVDALASAKDLDHAGEYTLDERLAILRRSTDCNASVLLEEYGHVWSNARTIKRDRALLRDRQNVEDDELDAQHEQRVAELARRFA